METSYEIALNMKTCQTMVPYACFKLGTDRCFAVNLFISLRGSSENRTDSVISADLIKNEQGLQQKMAKIHCSYLQLGENVKTITKELFRNLNLETGR